MTIQTLYKKHFGRTIYIVGTGPSMRVFPTKFFDDKLTIGLNQAYKQFKPTYSITIHPYLIPYNRKEWNTLWCTKVKPTCEGWRRHISERNKNFFYLFENNNEVKDFSYFRDRSSYKLYVGRGIHTGAIHLAGLMGATNCILVGCDFCDIANESHCLDQHIELHGYSKEQIYKEYYYYLVKIRELSLAEFGMNVLSMSPFVGLPYYEEDYKRQLGQLNLPELPKPKEIEKVPRPKDLVTNFFQ